MTQRCVHRIAERIEDGADLVVDAVGERHHVEGGQAQVFGKRALLVDADPPCLGVEVELARRDLAGGLADQVAFAGTALAEAQPLDIAADSDDLARKFVAGDKRHRNRPRRPVVPLPDMDVGAADAGLVDADQDVVGPISGTGRVSSRGRFRGAAFTRAFISLS
jgi:hypothetical protein